MKSMLLALALSLLTACGSSPDPPPPPTLPPQMTASPARPASPTPDSAPVLQGTGPENAEVGREVYLRACAACHGVQAEGHANDLDAPALDGSEHATHHPDQQLHDWIVNGKLGLGREMPAFGDQLEDGEVHAVIAFLHTLWTEEQLQIQRDLSRRWPATPEPTWTAAP